MTVDAFTNTDIPRFGRLVRQHRIRIGMTQRQLADLSTISVRAIRDLEQGRARHPRQDTVRLIAEALRLGPKARADLTHAAFAGRRVFGLRSDEPARPPVAADPIVAREPELAVLEGELASGAERLVNVVGLTGVGKTRLVLEVVTQLHAKHHIPVLWHAMPDAAADIVHHPAEATGAAVQAAVEDLFGARDGGINDLIDLVGEAPAVLVVDGADGHRPRPERLDLLLRQASELRLVVTGDRPWGLPRERFYLLGPLELPQVRDERDAPTLARVPAVRLFLDRVYQERPHYTLTDDDVPAVAEICRQVDGLPIALRMAASWLIVFEMDVLRSCLDSDPEDLLDHVAGPDSGGRSYRAALARRLAGLPAPDRDLLGRLCELGGEFDLDDVMKLTGQRLPEAGRLIRRLLLHGVIRPWYEEGVCQFQVLNLVLASYLTSVPSADLWS